MTTPDWIRPAIDLTAATITITAAITARHHARTARAHALRAQRNSRQAWGGIARTELATLKIRNPQSRQDADRSDHNSRA
jgi:hypothetical protein